LTGFGPLLTINAGYSLLSPIYRVPKFKELFYPPPSSNTIEIWCSTLVAVTSILLSLSYPSTNTLIYFIIKSGSIAVNPILTLLISSGSKLNLAGSIVRSPVVFFPSC
jgi:hypothetical protein